ncbi:L-cysteine desulfhydrase-like [Vigna unguiculata]|uniref:L-cysteine desulfhydrase-like n=1 Tax=Vigna unguiculata TaxID=3917 RepID=UPI001015F3E7|nr:L-cysteine desulfhydrase-like [Vigna unguiculata]XP_027937791.1 L-cysteine desulfhydrase-like [Vigna unguiculata]XP_027937792.1 L-cysteine desulfhydrase-like [Vigna unguiculata]
MLSPTSNPPINQTMTTLPQSHNPIPNPSMDNQIHRNGAVEPNHRAAKKPKLAHSISDSEIREEFSHHQRGVARINNGSFGSCPRSVLAAQSAWQLRFLQQPDDFFFNVLRGGILESRAIVADLINADHIDRVSLVDNATTAAAIVLQQIGRRFVHGHFRREDSVIMFHCAYQAVKKSIEAYVTPIGGTVVEVQLPFPVRSDEEIVSEFKKGIEKGKLNGGRVRLAIIDHVTSMPSVVLPVRELIKVCREQGVEQVFVDGAHAIGSLPVDVKEIGADFYVSNLYKWFFSPPSVAFLYCKENSNDVHHPIVSQEYGKGLPVESAWVGMRDYSPQLVVPSILEFVNRFEGGIAGIMQRNHDEVVKMGTMLAESWGTILGSPPVMCASMIMVGLPSKLCVMSDDDALRLRSYLRVYHAIEVPVYYQVLRNDDRDPRDKNGYITGYVRISHQVYNTVDDYQKLKTAINQLLEDGKICSGLPTE